jgi:hypothetical protein
MATSRNAGAFNRLITGDMAGGLQFQKFIFDFAQTSYAPTSIITGSKIQIGCVPAGFKLVPALCRLALPAVDTSGTSSDYTIGNDDDVDSLKGSAAAETAQTYFGEDWLVTTGEIGSATDDVPIYLYYTGTVGTIAATGKIYFDQVIRPFDSATD